MPSSLYYPQYVVKYLSCSRYSINICGSSIWISNFQPWTTNVHSLLSVMSLAWTMSNTNFSLNFIKKFRNWVVLKKPIYILNNLWLQQIIGDLVYLDTSLAFSEFPKGSLSDSLKELTILEIIYGTIRQRVSS